MTEDEAKAWDSTFAGADEQRVRAVTRLKQEFKLALQPLARALLRAFA